MGRVYYDGTLCMKTEIIFFNDRLKLSLTDELSPLPFSLRKINHHNAGETGGIFVPLFTEVNIAKLEFPNRPFFSGACDTKIMEALRHLPTTKGLGNIAGQCIPFIILKNNHGLICW